jgi:hypothetical protein
MGAKMHPKSQLTKLKAVQLHLARRVAVTRFFGEYLEGTTQQSLGL